MGGHDQDHPAQDRKHQHHDECTRSLGIVEPHGFGFRPRVTIPTRIPSRAAPRSRSASSSQGVSAARTSTDRPCPAYLQSSPPSFFRSPSSLTDSSLGNAGLQRWSRVPSGAAARRISSCVFTSELPSALSIQGTRAARNNAACDTVRCTMILDSQLVTFFLPAAIPEQERVNAHLWSELAHLTVEKRLEQNLQ